MRLVLASASPRRRELLAGILPHFEVEPSLFEESAKGLSAYQTVLCFAQGKAREVFSRFPDRAVLGADTVVCLEGKILGKPKDEGDAFRMLRSLSGKKHSVYTGVCLKSGKGELCVTVGTEVLFNELSDFLISEYVGSGKPLDKAGAYGIQDGFPLVREIKGSYTNVVGLPVEETRVLLEKHGGILC